MEAPLDSDPRVLPTQRGVEELGVVVNRLPLLGEHSAPVPELRGDRVLYTPGERVDEPIAERAQGLQTDGLRLANVGRNDRDRRARSPLGSGDGVVVLRLDTDLHGHVALLDERVRRPEDVAPFVGARFSVEARQHAPVLASAGAQHEVHLAEAVVVGRVVADRDLPCVLGARELDALWRAIERDDGHFVVDRRDVRGSRLVDGHLAEPGDDAQVDGVSERPTRDDAPLPVFDERDLARAVGEQELPADMARRPADRQQSAAREDEIPAGGLLVLVLMKVLGGTRVDHRLVEPRKGDGRHVVPRDEHIEPFEHGPRREGGEAEHGDREHERRVREPGGDPRCAALDGVAGERGQRAAHVEGGQLRRRPLVESPSFVEETERPLRPRRADRVDVAREAVDGFVRIAPAARVATDDDGEAERGDQQRPPRDGTRAHRPGARDEEREHEKER